MKVFKKISVFGVLVVLLILGAKDYLGYHYFYKYKNVRSQAKSIERSFSELEGNLKKAVRFFENPMFYKEMTRLYFEMALAENQFGTAEKRDFYLNQARDSIVRVIKINPIDAFAYYDMGKVYMLYNFPLLTYMDKGRLYFRKALELKPADEFLNLNIIYIYLTQWESLNKGENSFISEKLRSMRKINENFIPQLKRRWRENFGNEKKLEEILELISSK